YVARLHKAIVGQEPSAQALDLWAARMDAGLSHAEILDEMANLQPPRNGSDGAPLAFPPGHYYSPIVDPAQASEHLSRMRIRRRELPGIALDPDTMIAFWRSLAPFLQEQPFPGKQESGRRYWFENPAYSFGDGTLLYAMLRHFKPRRYVEIGSGYSSACALETAERWLGEDIQLTFIEPYPDLLKRLISDPPPKRTVEIIPQRVQDVPMRLFKSLSANDVLFIDSTHVLKTGSDVVFELLEVLPRLKSGVVVHVHDIPWPFEYSKGWVVDQNRSWNEVYALRAFLTHNNDFEILYFGDYFRRFHREEIEAVAPWALNNNGASIWLRRR
ncbi:MAG: class I SAM-dependent methyltransferase, partial [Caulobacteraceae bacterium]